MRIFTHRRGLTVAALAAAVNPLVGCRVGPEPAPPIAAPAGDAFLPDLRASPDRAPGASVEVAPDPTWWRGLRDPVLDELVARAESGNQSLAASMANVRAAYAAVGASEADLWPSIGAGAQYERTLTNIAQLASTGVVVEPYDMYAYGIGMSSWEIDLWGGVGRQVEAAKASAESELESLRDALVSVRAQVVSNYLQLRTLEAKRRVLVASSDALAKTRDLVRARFAAGTTNGLDVARAEAQVDAVLAQIPQVDAGIASTKASLAALCGGYPADIAGILAQGSAIPAPPDVVGIGLPAELLDRRPDVRAARRRVEAATALIGVAEAQRLPRLTISGNFYIASNNISGLGELSNKAYSIGPALWLPLFEGGRIESAVRQQRAEAEAALAAYRGTVLGAIADLGAGVSDFVQAGETLRLADAAMASAERALSLAQQQFDAGVTDFTTLLDVQRAVLDAESAAVDARGGFAQGFVSLQKSLGAGWENSEAIAAATQSDRGDAKTAAPATGTTENTP